MVQQCSGFQCAHSLYPSKFGFHLWPVKVGDGKWNKDPNSTWPKIQFILNIITIIIYVSTVLFLADSHLNVRNEEEGMA